MIKQKEYKNATLVTINCFSNYFLTRKFINSSNVIVDMEKLSVKALAIGLGVSWGAYVFLLGLMALFGLGTKVVEILASVYIGYSPTFIGSIIGAVWGFIDGAIGGAIIALIYNAVIKR